jgi:hypothetical protein
MVLSNFTLSNNIPDSPDPVVTTLNLNEIFRESMNRFQSGLQAPNMIVRCEPLPAIQGNRLLIARLFENLISMIVHHRPVSSKLYLYIDCQEPKGMSNELLEKDVKQYIVRFHTNITSTEEWKINNRQLITECEKCVLAHNGAFSVNNIQNTGCLFSISFPGKFQ